MAPLTAWVTLMASKWQRDSASPVVRFAGDFSQRTTVSAEHENMKTLPICNNCSNEDLHPDAVLYNWCAALAHALPF